MVASIYMFQSYMTIHVYLESWFVERAVFICNFLAFNIQKRTLLALPLYLENWANERSIVQYNALQIISNSFVFIQDCSEVLLFIKLCSSWSISTFEYWRWYSCWLLIFILKVLYCMI